jgi:tetratricopeptide (TPR) repeat protein
MMGRQPKPPNLQLAALADEAGLSHKGLARRVINAGESKGIQGLRYNHSSVTRWIAGEQPKEPVPELIADVISLTLGRPITVTNIGMQPSTVTADLGLDMSGGWPDRVASVAALWRADVLRRQFLADTVLTVSASSTAALRWLTSPPVEPPIGKGLRRIGMADVQAIREVTRTYRELDNRLGGVRLRTIVVHYLDNEVAPLLKEGRYNDEIGRCLAGAGAELAQLAGWLSYDTEMHGLAQRHLLQALSLAEAAGDSALCGEIMAAISHQSVYVAQPAAAIDLARTGQAAARRAGLPTLQTECHVMEAHGHAARNDARACAAALVRAERTFDKTTRANVPTWLSYFDAAYLAAKFGQCFRDLGQGDKAEQYARRSLNMDGRYIRGKAFNQTLLAVAYVQQKQIEKACAEGHVAVGLVADLSSGRANGYIRDLRRRLQPYADTAEVREFNEYAETKLPALQPTARHAGLR